MRGRGIDTAAVWTAGVRAVTAEPLDPCSTIYISFVGNTLHWSGITPSHLWSGIKIFCMELVLQSIWTSSFNIMDENSTITGDMTSFALWFPDSSSDLNKIIRRFCPSLWPMGPMSAVRKLGCRGENCSSVWFNFYVVSRYFNDYNLDNSWLFDNARLSICN